MQRSIGCCALIWKFNLPISCCACFCKLNLYIYIKSNQLQVAAISFALGLYFLSCPLQEYFRKATYWDRSYRSTSYYIILLEKCKHLLPYVKDPSIRESRLNVLPFPYIPSSNSLLHTYFPHVLRAFSRSS